MLRIGVVGLKRGCAFLRAARAHPDTEAVAVCDIDERKFDRVDNIDTIEKKYTEYEKFLEHDLDLVVIATPIPEHVPQAIPALKLDLHVISELTAVYTMDECEPLVEAVENSKGKYMLAENCCYLADIQSWQSIVEQGRLGEIMYAEAEYVHDIRSLLTDEDGNPTWRASRPPIHYITHSLGPLLQVIDDRCVSVSAMSTGSKMCPELGNIDMEVAIFTTEQDAVIKILRGSAVAREPSFHFYSVYGTNGVLERKRPGNGEEGTLAYFEDIPHGHGMNELALKGVHPHLSGRAQVGHGTSDYMMFDSFVRCILDDTPSPIDVYRGLDFTVPGLCAHRSAENGGQLIEIPNFKKSD